MLRSALEILLCTGYGDHSYVIYTYSRCNARVGDQRRASPNARTESSACRRSTRSARQSRRELLHLLRLSSPSMLRLAHCIEVAMKAIPLMGRCSAGAGGCRWRGEGSGDRRRWRWRLVAALLLVVVVFLLASSPTTLIAGRRLGFTIILLLPRFFFGLPLRLDARDLLLAHCYFLWGVRVDYLRREAWICEMRIARVDEVDRVRGGEAGGGRLGADVTRARRRGRLCPSRVGVRLGLRKNL